MVYNKLRFMTRKIAESGEEKAMNRAPNEAYIEFLAADN